MTHPIGEFLNGLREGAVQGTAFRWARDDRRQAQGDRIEDREYERARRLREEVAFNLAQERAARDPLADERALRDAGLGRYYDRPEEPRPETGSDFDFITGPDGRVTRVRKVGPEGVVPGVRARVPDGGGDPMTRAKPGTPEHRQGWIAARLRQLRRVDEFGEMMPLEEAVQAAQDEYQAAYPPPPAPRGPTLPRGGGPSPFLRPRAGTAGTAPKAPTVPFEERARQLARELNGDIQKVAAQLRQEGYDFDE